MAAPYRLGESRLNVRLSTRSTTRHATIRNLFGLLPVLFSTGVGSDMARRMAGPMFGGLVTLTFMTALVLPAMWVLWRTRQLRKGTLASALAVSKAEE